jgi:hypothetical protein
MWAAGQHRPCNPDAHAHTHTHRNHTHTGLHPRPPTGMYSSSPGASTVSIKGSPSSDRSSLSFSLPLAKGSAPGLAEGAGGAYTRQRLRPCVCSTNTCRGGGRRRCTAHTHTHTYIHVHKKARACERAEQPDARIAGVQCRMMHVGTVAQEGCWTYVLLVGVGGRRGGLPRRREVHVQRRGEPAGGGTGQGGEIGLVGA